MERWTFTRAQHARDEKKERPAVKFLVAKKEERSTRRTLTTSIGGNLGNGGVSQGGLKKLKEEIYC